MRTRATIELPTGIALGEKVTLYPDRNRREGPAVCVIVKCWRMAPDKIGVELDLDVALIAEYLSRTDVEVERRAQGAGAIASSEGLRVAIKNGEPTKRMIPEDRR